jgi:hypothetical protein
MKYLVVDGNLHGTGIRDYYNGGYIEPESLGLDLNIVQRIHKWMDVYENEHYNSFENEDMIKQLDDEGKEIAFLIKRELKNIKVYYFSAALLNTYII